MRHHIRVRRLPRSHRMQNLVRRGRVGLHPHVDQPKYGVIISLSAEHKIPTSFDASFLDLESRQIVTEKRVGFDHAEPPVGFVPPVVIFLQLNSDSRHRSCGWSQSSRINPTDVKTWRFDVGDMGNLGFPTMDAVLVAPVRLRDALRNDQTKAPRSRRDHFDRCCAVARPEPNPGDHAPPRRSAS